MAAMNEALSANKSKYLIGSFDATQFIISGKNEELLVTIKSNNDDESSQVIPLTEIEISTLSQAVKWIMLCNANGQVADDVFLLSDAIMNEEEFTLTEIKGLSHNVDPSASGWLCFAKTRGGNKISFPGT